MSDTTVRLLADERLDALWGQSLLIGGYTLALPEEPAPVEVPAWVGAILVAQDGWRYAPTPVPAPVPRPLAGFGGTGSVFAKDEASFSHVAKRKKPRVHGRGLEVARANRKD